VQLHKTEWSLGKSQIYRTHEKQWLF
jgi:hypothetical protein